jgi:hypothetical protein
MKRDITPELLAMLIKELRPAGKPAAPVQAPHAKPSQLMKNLLGKSPSESPAEIAKLKSALAVLSSGVKRGTGSFYDIAGQPVAEYWVAAIWAIAGLGWSSGKEIARGWSKKSPDFYDVAGFEKAWGEFKPEHRNPVGIGSLYKRAIQAGWQFQTASAQPVQNASRYKLLDSAHMQAMPPLNWRIKGVLPSEGLAALFGPSASGKSFLALDMAAAIVQGRSWFGNRTSSATVVYVALEGEGGFKNRVTAWERENLSPIPTALNFVMQPFKINDPEDVDDLAAVVPKGSAIFIDTLNRAAPLADENLSRDMGEILEGAKRLQIATAGLVVLVHHTGKDVGKGLRGHSSLFAALDAAIQVERSVVGRAWAVAKAKDGEDGGKFPFKLKRHVLGQDADGDEITSCTVERDNPLLFQQADPKGSAQKAALRSLRSAIKASAEMGRGDCAALTKCLRSEDAVTVVIETLAGVEANKRRNRARTLLQDLLTSGHLLSGLEGDDGWVWLPS